MDDATLDTLARELRKERPEGASDASYRPPAAFVSPDPSPASPDAIEVGFVPVGLLGQGGMGEVYKAHQVSLDREVALKQARNVYPLADLHLRLEALANGRLEHPNIVPIYELTSNQGQPAIAMKLASGKPWKALLGEARSLSFHLEILIKVCDAVAYAHSKNIVHNDLKPSNVMVGAFGEVLLMDWGLAAEIGPLDTRSRLRHKSHVQGCCGTPCYMAPELARGDGLRIGAWTDIYLLGGLLFRMLCGRPPHRGSLEEALASALRPEPPALPPQVVRDTPLLAAACTRALQPDPQQRFASVAEFQAELRAHLEHRESQAIANRAAEQLADCQARAAQAGEEHRLRLYEDYAQAVAGFGAARQLWADNGLAKDGEGRARQAYAEAALHNGDLGLARAQLQRLQQQGMPVEDLEQRVVRARAKAAHERRARRRLRGMLAGALVVILLGLIAGQVYMQMTNAQIAAQGLRIEAKRRLAECAADVAFEVLESMSLEATYVLENELGDPNAARVRREILSSTAQAWRDLARALTGEDSTALTTARARQQYGLTLIESGQSSEGLHELEAALRALAAAEEPAARQLRVLALTQRARLQLLFTMPGASASAEDAWAALEDVSPEVPAKLVAELAMEWERIGFAHEHASQLAAARQALERALSLRERLPGEAAPQLLVQLLMRMAQLDHSAGSFARSEQLLQRAIAAAEQAVAEAQGAEAAELRTLLVVVLSDASDLRFNQGQMQSALALTGRAVEVGEARLLENPENIRCQRALAEALGDLGRLHYRTAAPEAAAQAFERALQLREPLVRRFPEETRLVFGLSDSLENLARLAAERGETGRAESLLVRCCDLRAQLQAQEPNADRLNELTSARMARAVLWLDQGQLDRAEATFREALGVFARLLAEAPETRLHALELVEAQLNLARTLEMRGQLDEAAGLCQEAIARLQRVVEAQGTTVQTRQRVARARLQTATLAEARGDPAAARDHYLHAVEALRQALEREPLLAPVRKELALCLTRLGTIASAAAGAAQARAYLLEALEHHQRLLQAKPWLCDLQQLQACATELARLVDPTEALPYLTLAREMGMRRLAQAPDDLPLHTEVFKLQVHEGRALWNSGSLALAGERFAAALELALTVFAAHPDNIGAGIHVVEMHFNLFTIRHALGDRQGAVDALTAARDVQRHQARLSPRQQPRLEELEALLLHLRGQNELQRLLRMRSPEPMVVALGLYQQRAYQDALDGLQPALEAECPAQLLLMAAVAAALAGLEPGAERGALEEQAFGYLARFFEQRQRELQSDPEPEQLETFAVLRRFLRHQYTGFSGLRVRPGFAALFAEGGEDVP